MLQNELIFRPFFVQKGRGPHLHDFALTLDENGDVFKSDIEVTQKGIKISDVKGNNKFSISVRWNVEGYGYLFMPVDNAGSLYEIPENGAKVLNLNFELFLTRANRNRKRLDSFINDNWQPSGELLAFIDLSNEYLGDAVKNLQNPENCARISQTGLKYALMASDLLEIEKARSDVIKKGYRPDFFFGCDARAYFQMDKSLFLERFSELFNYATITHYLKGDFVDFEPLEGKKNYKERDELLKQLQAHGISVEGRPLFWVHTWVTPDWLKQKSYSDILKYVERHIRETIDHYGDEIAIWEVVNELHDWANEVELNHGQTIELTKLACQVARDTNPNVKLLINNCCPFADYVQLGKWHEREAKFPQRTPYQFTKQLVDSGVDFDLIGVQVYFVKRTLAETVAYIERYQDFGKKLQLAEVGSPSKGITQEFLGEEEDFSTQPYEWRRHWDEELQGDWLEYIFTLAYSKPSIEAANWYDFVDPYGFLRYGGLMRSAQGEKKAAVDRLLSLKKQWSKIKKIVDDKFLSSRG
jgi:GH35 family endo-1,4-beta-xylanase